MPIIYEAPVLTADQRASFRAFVTQSDGLALMRFLEGQSQMLDTEATNAKERPELACGVARGYRRMLLDLKTISSDRSTLDAETAGTEGDQAAPESETPRPGQGIE